MTSTYTTNKNLEKPGNNDYIDTWNVPVNADWDIIDKAFGGVTTLTDTSGTRTLADTEYQALILASTATLVGNVTYRIPSGVGGQWVVDNRTTGAYTFTISSLGGGTSVTCTQNARTLIFSDGTNIRLSSDATVTSGTGITVSGGQVNLDVPVTAVRGGTGFTTYTTGDIIYASGTNTLAKLSAGTAGYILTMSGGVPVWAANAGGGGGGGTVTSITVDGGTTGLSFTPATPVTTSGTFSMQGTLGAGYGGTGFSSYAVGDILYANTGSTLAKLAGTATGNALISGGVGAAPSWGKIGLTTHVSGTLPVANGGTGTASTPSNGQLLIGNGSGFTLASLTNGTGIGVSGGAGSITISNSGVTSVAAGTGISVSGSTGSVTITNTGPSSIVAGTDGGISVSGTSTVTIAQAPYTGTSATNTNYPIGSMVILESSTNTPGTPGFYMNQSTTLYAGTSPFTPYNVNDLGSGSALSGTWRFRGLSGVDTGAGKYYYMYQRVS
jgi:hypothetical protein